MGFPTNEVQRLKIIQQIQKKNVQLKAVLEKIKTEKNTEEWGRVFGDGYDGPTQHYLEGTVLQVLEDKKILVSIKKEDDHQIETITVAVTNYSSSMFDAAAVRINAKQLGVYKYLSVNNTMKTVPLFDFGTPYKSEKLPALYEEAAELKKEIAELYKAFSEIK